ncbi:MAG: hypothetical protein WA208_02105 [Thermoanaerobaculia bacterium]
MSKKDDDRRVFRAGHRNVVLNFRNSPDSEFGFYGYAFHEAAQALVREMLSRPGYSDLEALPVVYLYRHALELYLKAILVIGNQLLAVNGDDITEKDLQRVLNSHRLTPFLPHLRTILDAAGMEWFVDEPKELRSMEDLSKVLREIEEVDADSFAFRYPVTKRGDGALPHAFEFDLRACVDVLDHLIEMLDAALSCLDSMWDAVDEPSYPD